jgi:hypothetical protein
MVSQTTYILKQSDDDGRPGRIVSMVLLVAIPLLLVFGAWYWYVRGSATGPGVQENWLYTHPERFIQRLANDKPTGGTNKPGQFTQPVLENNRATPVKDNIAVKEAKMQKQLFGIVQRKNGDGIFAAFPGVTVFCMYNGIRIESHSDKAGNYALTVPWDGSTGIDCKIQLFYQTDTGLIKSQTVTCDQGHVPTIDLN